MCIYVYMYVYIYIYIYVCIYIYIYIYIYISRPGRAPGCGRGPTRQPSIHIHQYIFTVPILKTGILYSK